MTGVPCHIRKLIQQRRRPCYLCMRLMTPTPAQREYCAKHCQYGVRP